MSAQAGQNDKEEDEHYHLTTEGDVNKATIAVRSKKIIKNCAPLIVVLWKWT